MGSITQELALEEKLNRESEDNAKVFGSFLKAVVSDYTDRETAQPQTIIDMHNQAKVNRRSIEDSQNFSGWQDLSKNPRHELVANVISSSVEVDAPTLNVKIDVSGKNTDEIADFLRQFTIFANKHAVGVKIHHTFLEGKVQTDKIRVFPTQPASF